MFDDNKNLKKKNNKKNLRIIKILEEEEIISIRVFSGSKKRTTYIAVLRNGETKRISLETFLIFNDFMQCEIIHIEKEEKIFSLIKKRLKDANILYWTPNKECWGIKVINKKCIKFLIFKSKTFKDIRRFYNALNSSQVFFPSRSAARYIIKDSSFIIDKTNKWVTVSNSKYGTGFNNIIKIGFIKYEGNENKLFEKNYKEFEQLYLSNI